MFKSATLDNLIALIVTILALCLIVQSVQQAVKKLLKIKSRQLEESLVDLLETALGMSVVERRPVSPVFNLMTRSRTSVERAAPEVRALHSAVISEFQKIGRISQSGKVMLDSIVKEDLLKIMRKIAPGILLPGTNFNRILESASGQLTAIEEILNSPATASLEGAAAAKFAEIKERLIPVITDFSNLAAHGEINPELTIEHLLEIRQVGIRDLFDLLSGSCDRIEKQLAETGNPQVKSDLTAVLNALHTLPSRITAFRQCLDAAVAPLRMRLRELETWFDVVMQSFEERYARGMKTWGIVISAMVVILLNANVFEIYHKIAASETTRSALVRAADAVASRAAAPAPDDARKSLEEIQNDLAQYQQFQFQPLTWDSFESWRQGRNYGPGQRFWQRRQQDLGVVLGWTFMTLLLSVGAPFWEDALEAVFGAKNLIRHGTFARPSPHCNHASSTTEA